ncbi:histidine ammonia-lyase [Paenibacillus mucilaginosus 3016]|uniref:Histidine ammonia-lyase n=1 Tax=Paenibacillus mucilaginosus 3016 TaxID=1116391 RepID=H6NEX4_9BACL|nr:histidine ammonia-lyase [Paenibacillus mucilaginosus]AFC28665.1 histidine ammonia-lyase [Paenibacillus mucilaginosus 3016]
MKRRDNAPIRIGDQRLTLAEVERAARSGAPVVVEKGCISRMQASCDYVRKLLEERQVVYGLTTGFGKFSDTVIADGDVLRLQLNLIRSHACGVGSPLPEDTVRAVMLLRIRALALGWSGIRPCVVELLAGLLNRGVTPVMPEQGSLGASGDLAPLAHLALVLVGEGEAFFEGARLPGGEALARAGLQPVILEAKEGLALINGTQVMTAIGTLACADARRLADLADCTAALTCEGLRAVRDAFDGLTHGLRPHRGQRRSAENIRRMTEGSRLLTGPGELRVQDAYSLRCAPQVHGASRDGLDYIAGVLETEINSATDNPLIFAEEGRVISGGNFHGQPVALAMDHLALCAAELASIAERRIERLVNPQLNEGLPPFLTHRGGLQSGFMIAQYTAASLVSENKSLAHPASVDSIPSSGNQEDHVSMGTIAARKAARIVSHGFEVLAIELLCAAQAADYRGPSGLAPGTRWLYDRCRERVPFMGEDRVLSGDFRRISEWLRSVDAAAELGWPGEAEGTAEAGGPGGGRRKAASADAGEEEQDGGRSEEPDGPCPAGDAAQHQGLGAGSGPPDADEQPGP